MKVTTSMISLLAGGIMLTGMLAQPADAQVTRETTDVFGQGPGGPVVSVNGATLMRSDKGITISLGMPTPVPGFYDYPPGNIFQPEGAHPGHPEAYSFWAFVFNAPENCTMDPCSPPVDALAGQMGVFNVAGHVVGGPRLQLTGHVSINDEQFAGPSPLTAPRTAEVHVAVAPHGELQPDIMPLQITRPIGDPDFWWIALFLPE